MKKSHKKIGVIVLTGLALTGPGLSPTFVAHAEYDLLNQCLLKDPNKKLSTEATFAYMKVKKLQRTHRYDAVYLGDSDEFIERFKTSSDGKRSILIPKRNKERNYYLEPGTNYFFLKFEDESSFSKRVSEGILDYYRRRDEGIIIKVVDSYFLIYFNLTPHQRNTIPMKVLAKEFGFSVGYGDWNNFYGLYVMHSYLDNRHDFKDKPELREKLLEQPRKKGENVFLNAEEFSYYLKSNLILNKDIIKRGYSRYRVGDYDYIIYY